jgi:hypothetical protein
MVSFSQHFWLVRHIFHFLPCYLNKKDDEFQDNTNAVMWWLKSGGRHRLDGESETPLYVQIDNSENRIL